MQKFSRPFLIRQKCSEAVAHIAVALTLLSGATSAFAQSSSIPLTEKWRPKNGIYASPGKDFDKECRESGDIVIDLSEKSARGFEWHCEINKIMDTAPGAIKLSMTCYDLNMPDSAGPDSQERPFKEVMLLNRANQKSMSIRKTINGKFTSATWQADLCPEDVQRAYIQAKIDSDEARKYKVPDQLLDPKQWRPKDGIYASPGPDFTDRCAKSGDVVLGLADGLVSSGKVECKAVGLMNTGQAEFSMDLTCNQPAGKQASKKKAQDAAPRGRVEPESSSADSIRMKRIDDNTFHMQKTVEKKFRDDGGPVAYCPEEAQRNYAAKKAKN